MRAPDAKRPLKILYHHRTASRDGQAVHIEELIAAFRELGCEVIVVEPRTTASTEFGGEAKRLSLLRSLMPKVLAELAELAYSWVAYRRLERAYLAHRPDILYERHNLFLLAGKWLKQRFNIPYILEVNSPIALERAEHGGLALRRLAQALESSVWKAADAVLPVTGVLASILAEHGVPRERMHVIRNAINVRAFERAPARAQAKKRLGLQDKLVLGFTGFVRAWHGLDQVIDFIAAARRADLVLVIAGDGPARAELAQRAAQLGIGAQVHFTGIVQRGDIPSVVSAFDIALQPAATPYASPLKLFEYLAAGCAVVAPRQANIEEVVADGENGLLFSPAEPRGLSHALERLVNDAQLRQRLGEAARASVEKRRLTWTANARQVLDIAHQLLASRGAPEMPQPAALHAVELKK